MLERPILLQMTDELAVPDRLKRGQARVQTLGQQAGDLFNPALFDHPGDATRNLIV